MLPTTLQASMADHIALTTALARHLNAIHPDYGVYASAFIAVGFLRAEELRYCREADVPTVPKGPLRLILAGTAGTEF